MAPPANTPAAVPPVLLLLAAAVVSGVVWAVEREAALPYEALVILTIVFLNAALGLFQEGKAEQALAACRDTLRQESAFHDAERDVFRTVSLFGYVEKRFILLAEGELDLIEQHLQQLRQCHLHRRH